MSRCYVSERFSIQKDLIMNVYKIGTLYDARSHYAHSTKK